MKVLVESNVSSAVMSNPGEDSSYPASNLLDEHPKKVAKADASETVTVSLVVDGAGDWLGCLNTNARIAEVSVYDGASTLVYESILSLGGIDTYEEFIAGEGQALYEFDVCYPYQSALHTIVIELDTASAGVTAQIGGCLAGVGMESSIDTSRGMTEGLVDYSTVKELSNGATYIKKRDVVRTFNFSLVVERDREFYSFMHGVARTIGSSPILWKVTDLSNSDWLLFGRLGEQPSAVHSYHKYSTITFNILEVL